MTHFVPGNRITLLHNGSEYFPALEAAFDAAQHEIFLETYIFEPDEAGRRIAQALMRAARRGVAAHVLMDGFGSHTLPQSFIDEMLAAGVQVLMFRAVTSLLQFRRRRLRRLHRKLVVVDARVAFVGGINVIDDMHTPGQTPPRYDYAVRVEGPLLAEIHAAARRLWTQVSWYHVKQQWHAHDMAPRVESCGSQRAAFLMRDNLRHRNDIEEAYLNALRHARSEVILANAYFLPGLRFRHALVQAAARGVRVVLLLQGRVEYMLLHYASHALYGSFLDAGIEIFEYHKSFLHAKVAVIDGHWATVGSSNIDPFSLLLAREANVVVEDRAFAGRLREDLLQAMTQGARQVMPEHWKKQWLLVRVLSWLSYSAVRLLTGISAYGRGRESSAERNP